MHYTTPWTKRTKNKTNSSLVSSFFFSYKKASRLKSIFKFKAHTSNKIIISSSVGGIRIRIRESTEDSLVHRCEYFFRYGRQSWTFRRKSCVEVSRVQCMLDRRFERWFQHSSFQFLPRNILLKIHKSIIVFVSSTINKKSILTQKNVWQAISCPGILLPASFSNKLTRISVELWLR